MVLQDMRCEAGWSSSISQCRSLEIKDTHADLVFLSLGWVFSYTERMKEFLSTELSRISLSSCYFPPRELTGTLYQASTSLLESFPSHLCTCLLLTLLKL